MPNYQGPTKSSINHKTNKFYDTTRYESYTAEYNFWIKVLEFTIDMLMQKVELLTNILQRLKKHQRTPTIGERYILFKDWFQVSIGYLEYRVSTILMKSEARNEDKYMRSVVRDIYHKRSRIHDLKNLLDDYENNFPDKSSFKSDVSRRTKIQRDMKIFEDSINQLKEYENYNTNHKQ